jgi:hypothetical protein
MMSKGINMQPTNMQPTNDEIQAAIDRRTRYARRVRARRTPDERIEAFVRLQRAAFQLLESSPDGYRHFLRRNFHARRAEVVDGQWKPLEPARRALLP